MIGIGNPDRGDDGAGRRVVQCLRGRLPADVRLEEQSGTAADLIESLRDADAVFLIDAAVSGAPAGTIHVMDCTIARDLPPLRSGASTHGQGVPEALALARLLHGLPRVCMLYAVEGAVFTPGAGLSPSVAAAAEALAARLERELQSG